MRRKRAVVLFNLGGPDGPDAVKPFLFNLFNDPAIIGLPGPLRTLVARLISSRREKPAQANYALMGGASPLLRETRAQAEALAAALEEPGVETRVFIAMRYWKPFAAQTAAEVAAFAPDEIVLLPLYPQYSTTTSGSSLAEWARRYKGPGVSRTVCCHPDDAGLADAHAGLILATWEAAGRPSPIRLLFSAHGLPEKIVTAGDPYQMQMERTCQAVAARLGEGWDWSLCYQSRVGPMKWLGPSTPEALYKAAADRVGVLVVPIAFVSEHVETLVELDHEYGELAQEIGLVPYLRVPALGVAPDFIAGLAAAVRRARGQATPVECARGGRLCGAEWSKCPARAAPAPELEVPVLALAPAMSMR